MSIQVSLSGLSFFVLNLTTSNIEYLESLNFDKKQTPKELLDHLVHYLNSTPVLNQEFSKVTWPTRKEAIVTTAMVFVMVFIMSIFFLGVDQVLSWGIGLILGLGR